MSEWTIGSGTKGWITNCLYKKHTEKLTRQKKHLATKIEVVTHIGWTAHGGVKKYIEYILERKRNVNQREVRCTCLYNRSWCSSSGIYTTPPKAPPLQLSKFSSSSLQKETNRCYRSNTALLGPHSVFSLSSTSSEKSTAWSSPPLLSTFLFKVNNNIIFRKRPWDVSDTQTKRERRVQVCYR